MDVSIIMINYNTYSLSLNAIKSIIDYTKNLEYEIILLDNCSPDGSGTLLKKELGNKITYIQCNENLGTSKAFNIGAKAATGRYILWLNTDILLKDNFILKLFDYMEKNPYCGICGGNLFNMDNAPVHSYKRDMPSLHTVKRDFSLLYALFNRIFKKRLSLEFNYSGKPKEVGYITGADMMVRRALVDELNGFDEDIFMYAEELEFTFRVKKFTQFKVFSVPYAEMYHLEGASFVESNNVNERRFNLVLNGNFIYFKKSYGDDAALKYLKILRFAYKKLYLLCAFLFLKKRKLKYKRKYEIVSKRYNEIRNIM